MKTVGLKKCKLCHIRFLLLICKGGEEILTYDPKVKPSKNGSSYEGS